MRDRIRNALTRDVTMPRWAIALDLVYRLLILGGAIIVVVLWWQAATRDAEADRNARIQSCSSGYAATYSAWDAEANRLFGEIIARAATEQPPDPAMVDDYQQAVENTAAMARLRIGLADYAARSVTGGNNFGCPPLARGLTVEPLDPEGPEP